MAITEFLTPKRRIEYRTSVVLRGNSSGVRWSGAASFTLAGGHWQERELCLIASPGLWPLERTEAPFSGTHRIFLATPPPACMIAPDGAVRAVPRPSKLMR
jgi:hypothetical protein